MTWTATSFPDAAPHQLTAFKTQLCQCEKIKNVTKPQGQTVSEQLDLSESGLQAILDPWFCAYSSILGNRDIFGKGILKVNS